jgi:hypothetical protein
MPKPHTFPTLYNDVLQISITKLKEWEYLNPEQIKKGIITWSRNDNKRGSISIQVNTQNEQPYIELDYKSNDEPRNYKVHLVSIPSNLGKGNIWYFLCPKTNKRCRKLYSVGGFFYHREAFKNVFYESQTRGKNYRLLNQIYGGYFKADELYEHLYAKHFRKTYAGKPTKKYLRIMKELQKSEHITFTDIKEMLFK